MRFERADLDAPGFIALMEQHRLAMQAVSPLESQHALDLVGLAQPDVRVWVVRDGVELLGCGALQHLDDDHVEIKAMRTAREHQRRGVARAMLAHLLDEAHASGHLRASIETGTADYFEPARTLYASAGFTECGPFAGYADDPHSCYMTRALQA